MITDEEKKPKVLSTEELLKRFNAEKAGTPGAVNEELDPWGHQMVDPDSLLAGKASRPRVPEAKPIAEAKTEQDGWENANREIIDQEWDDKNIFEKAGAGWRKGVKYLKGGLQNFTADVMPKIGQIGSTLSGGAYTEDDIIEALSPVKTRAIKNMGEAAAIQGKGLVFETSQFMPQMVGAIAAMAAAPVTGGTSASAVPAMLGMGNIAALSGSVIGNTLYEVDKYAAEKGKDIPESTKWSVALLAGTAEFAAEKIRLGQYLPKGMTSKLLTRFLKEQPQVADDIIKKWAQSRPSMYRKFLELVKTTGTQGGEESIEEFFTQIAQDLTNFLYQNPDDRLNFKEIMTNALSAAKGGFMMGTMLGPISYGSNQASMKMRRKRAGGVNLVQANDGKVYEVVGGDESDNIYVQDNLGKQSSIKRTDVKDHVYLNTKQMTEVLDGYDKGTQILSQIDQQKQADEIAQADPEQMIRDLGKKYAYNGFNSELPDQNFIKYGEMKDGRMVIIKATSEATDPAEMLVTVVDAANPESKPEMVKGNMILNYMDVPYEEWVANEMSNYQATMSQISNQTAKATAPVQEGATITLNGKLFNVTQVTSEGVTLNEIDKDGNLTANTQVITPDQYEKVFGVPDQNAPQASKEATGPIETAPEVSTQQPKGQTAQTEQKVSPQSRKISDGKNEFTIIPQEDGNFRMSESFETQKEAEAALKKLQERYPKLTWSAEMTDSGDLFTPDTYTIVAAPKQKPAAPVAEAPKVKPEQKPVEAPKKEKETGRPFTPKEKERFLSQRNAMLDMLLQAKKYGDTPKGVIDGIFDIVEKEGRMKRTPGSEPGRFIIDPQYTEAENQIIEFLNNTYPEGSWDNPLQDMIDEMQNDIANVDNKRKRVVPAEEKQTAPEVKAEVQQPVSQAPSTPDETAAEEEVQNAGEVETTNAETAQVEPPEVAIAKAEGQVDLRPTEEQKKAGNYKKGHVNLLGFDISIENPAGSVRSGVSKDGTKWSNLMNNTYGYFRRTEGKDGDQVDVFLGDNLNTDAVYVIDQVDPETGVFDEHKTMLGFNSAESARENYLANYEPGWKGLGSITKMSMEGFKEWLGDAKRTRKPVDTKVPVKAAPAEQKQPEDTRPVKELKEKKGWPMSKADEARLSREPQSFEEAVYQFFIGRGRISTASLKHHLGTRSREDYASYIWAHKKDGQKTDKLNEAHIFQAHPELLKQTGDQQDQERAFMDILLSVHGLNDMRTRIDEMQRKADEINAEPVVPEAEEEIDYIDAGQVVDEEILPLEEEDPEILRIFELEINELGKTLDDLKNLAANDPDYFLVFPYGLNEKQFNELKSILNDTERQKQIIGLDHEVNQSESRSEGDNEVPGSPEPESRTDGESRGERGTEEPAISAEQLERERAAIEEWLPTSDHEDYISFEWDGESLEIFKGRDERIVGLSRDQLIEEGVRFPEAVAPAVGLKTSNHTVRSYANGLIDLDKAKEKINLALASLTSGRGFNQSFEDYMEQNPDVRKRNDELEAIKAYLATNPTPEQTREVLTEPLSNAKPEFAGEFFEKPREEKKSEGKSETKEYKYKMLARPFDVGTYPKEGFIRSENDPNGGFQILAYDRKLPVKEWSKWDFLPTSDIEQIEGKEFTDKDGEYSRISLEWTGNKRFATVSMYDTNGDLVEEPFSMSVKDIMQNIEMGYWIEKPAEEPNEATAVQTPTPAREIWQMTKQDFAYSPLRYDGMPTTDGAGVFRAEENPDGTWNAWVEFPDGKRDYWTRGGSAGEAWDGGKRKTAYMNQEADAKSLDRHRDAVIQALNEGKDVPQEVLNNYIGLKDYLEKQKKKEAAKPKEKESPIPANFKEQIDNLKALVIKESEGLDTNRRIAEINALETPTKAQIKERNQLRLILDNTRAEIARRNDKVDYNLIPENKAREIRKLIEEARAQDEVIGQRILRLQDERDAKEKSLQKRAGLFGDRKEEEERKSGMQPMFAGEIFEASSENLQSALKPFNDAIKKAEEEWKRNAQLLDQKIALVLSGAQMEIEMESPVEPASATPIDKESLPKHEDFGEKIGGARKDMGITRTVRDTDALPAWRRKYFYANVSGVMNLGDPTIDTSKPFLVKWSKEVKSWSGTRTVDYPVTTIDTRETKIFNSEEEAEAYIPIYEVWKQGFRIRKKEGNYIVTKTSSTGKIIEYASFPTEEEATTYMYSTEGATSLLNHKREDFSIPALDKVERTGKDWRKGKDVSTDEFMETFGFRGGEFGNWVKPEERRVMLNAAYDSFMDLAEMLNVPPRAMSLSGELSIAFGARGMKGAAAHFEPNRAVINMTRMNGAGSLAHEWAHALDNYFGLQGAKKDYTRDEEGELKAKGVMRTSADILSVRGMRKELSDIFDAIVKATQEKSVTRVMGIDEKQKAYDGQIKRLKDEADTLIRKFENGVRRYKYNRKAKKHEEVIVKATPEQIKRAQAIIDKIIGGKGTRPKWGHIPGSKGHMEYSYISPETLAMEELYKEVFGRSGLKRDGNGFYNLGYFADKAYAAKEILDKALAGESETLIIPTEFLKTSKKFDRSRANPYWSTKIEMFARAFEYFIQTKLESQNIRADYLQYDKAPVYDAVYEMNPYPAGEERTALNELFQKFFDEVKTKEEFGRTAMFRTGRRLISDPKLQQFEIILATNPMTDDVHTGIRSVKDIKTAEEAFKEIIDADDEAAPDFTASDMKQALVSGRITIYSSYPIQNGVFITPSKMQAEAYAGEGEVYSETVNIGDVAWIDYIEGQYAKVTDDAMFRTSNALYYSPVEIAIGAIKQNKATAKQWKAMLLNNGAKQAELDWMGWDDLAAQNESLTKEQIQAWIDQNKVEIKEVTHTDDKENARQRKLELHAEAGRRTIDEVQAHLGSRPYRIAATGEWVYRENDETTLNDYGDYKFSVQSVPEEFIDDLDKAQEAIEALEDFNEEHINIYGDFEMRGTKYGKYVLPGGKDYKELLLTMPDKTLPDDELVWKQNKQGLFAYFLRDRQVSGAFNESNPELQSLARSTINKTTTEGVKGNFKSSHWDEPNILAHVRFNTRTSEDGKNILFIEEIQSDWAQQGKKKGFSSDDIQAKPLLKNLRPGDVQSYQILDKTGRYIQDIAVQVTDNETVDQAEAIRRYKHNLGLVSDMPFKKTDQWAGLAIRRMIRYAIDEGYDAIAWTTGVQQAERYDLSKVVESVIVSRGTGRTSWKYKLFVTYNDGNNITEYANSPEELESYVGKELAEKIVNEDTGYGFNKTYAGLDLKVGGQGMKAFYDEILPAIANKIGKKYGASVSTTSVHRDESRLESGNTDELEFQGSDENGDPFFESTFGAAIGKGEDQLTGQPANYEVYQYLSDQGRFGNRRKLGVVPTLEKANQLLNSTPIAEDQMVEVHSLPITNTMLESFRQGVPMFRPGIIAKPKAETGFDALARILEADELDDQRHELKIKMESMSRELNTPVKAINNRNELPAHAQAQAQRIGVWENETMYGAWDEKTGTMYVLLDDLMKLGYPRAIDEGVKTILHEAVAHRGLPILLGDRGYDNLLGEIYESMPDDDLTLIRYQYGWTEDRKLIAEEYLGMMAEDNVNPSLLQRIIAKIRQILRKYFKVAYSKNDVHNLLRDSRRNLEKEPKGERGFYRSRPQPENFEYAGEYVQAQGTYFRTRKAASVKRNSPLGKAAEAYMEKAAKRTGEETVQGIREYIQDLSLPIRRFEEELLRRGGKQDNTSKPYRDMSLSFGRQEKLYNDYFEGNMKPILQAVADIKRAGIPGEDILPYIIAKHAMERNPAFRSRELKEWVESHKENVPQDEVNAKMEELKDKDYSGVMGFDTDKTYTNPDELARDIVSEFEGKVDAKLINNLWNKIGAATSEILDTWQRGYQITPEQKQEYLSQFRYFVPLRGWREGAAKELVYTKGEGFSRSLQYAKGRKSLADNPLAYLLNVQFQAIAEQVDNEVKTSMVNLIIKNLSNNEMHEMATIKKLYYVKITLPDGTEEWEPTTTRPPQGMFDAGYAKTKIYSEHERLRKPRQAREHEVYVRKPGGDMVMVFNGKHLSTAQAMNKQNYMYRTIFGNIYDARDLNKVMALMGHMNNMLKALYTSWNIVFPFTNFMRDFQEASITQQIKSKSGGKVIKNYRAAFPAIIRRIQGKQNLSNPMDQQLEDFYNLGGATGYTHMKSPEEIEEDINKEVARMVRKGSIAGGIGDAGHALFAAVEHWNKIFEDATRFSVYLSSLAIGNSKQDAAMDAKEASVNFNRKGKGSKAWDAWFAFFNVAVQSMQKNFKLAKDTPKRFTQIAFSFVMLGFLEAMMNALTDDEDDPDSSYYNLNSYMRQNYLVIPLPQIGNLRKKGNKYLSIPLPQFWRGFKSIGSIGFDVATGRMKAGEAVTTALGNFAGGLLPIDVGGFYKSGEFSVAPLVPTITKPVVELIENRNYMGYTIKKEPFTREQAKYLADAGLGKDNVNPAAKFFTDMLFRWSGGDSRYKYYTDKQGRTRKVLLDVNPSTVEHLFKGYTGGTGGVFSDLLTTVSQTLDPQQEVDFKNVPFVNKFLRTTPPAKWNIISEYYDLKEANDRDVTLMKEYEKQGRQTGNTSQYERMAEDEYRIERKMIFDSYEDQISDLTKGVTKDDMESSSLVIEQMDMCIGEIKRLEARYKRKY